MSANTLPIELTATDTKERVNEIVQKLEENVKAIFDSEKYKEYLTTMSKFHNYSINNVLLIAMQFPAATMVAGFNAWKRNFGRHVMEKEKGIKILAPAPYKKTIETQALDANGVPKVDASGKEVMEQKEITVPAFKVTTVFDVSQTDGKELPSLGVDMLTGDVAEYEKLWRILKEISPSPIELEEITTGANGYFNPVENRIGVRNDMSEIQTLKTAIHEIAHAKLHAIPEDGDRSELPDRRTKEVQAESVAYTVCQNLGLDTADYSFGYVAGWSSGKETEELKGSLEVIRSTSAEIINDIKEKYQALTKEVEKDEKPFDMEKTTKYLFGIADKVLKANEDKKQGISTFNLTVKRLNQLATEIPDEHKELKDLCTFVAESTELSSMKERIIEVTNFLQGKETQKEQEKPTPEKDEKPSKKPSVRNKLKAEKDKIAEDTKKSKTKEKVKEAEV